MAATSGNMQEVWERQNKEIKFLKRECVKEKRERERDKTLVSEQHATIAYKWT